jgi:hypothetical protein
MHDRGFEQIGTAAARARLEGMQPRGIAADAQMRARKMLAAQKFERGEPFEPHTVHAGAAEQRIFDETARRRIERRLDRGVAGIGKPQDRQLGTVLARGAERHVVESVQNRREPLVQVGSERRVGGIADVIGTQRPVAAEIDDRHRRIGRRVECIRERSRRDRAHKHDAGAGCARARMAIHAWHKRRCVAEREKRQRFCFNLRGGPRRALATRNQHATWPLQLPMST